MRITGSILARFSEVELGTADGKHYTLRTNPLIKLALRVIGIPHLGFRARARIIFNILDALPQRGKILDAGCGYGIYALTLAAEGKTVDAIDVEDSRIAAIRRMQAESAQSGLTTYVGSLTSLPLPDSSYDIVLCSDVIEHIAEHEAATSELARVVKPGGTLIISVPFDSANNRRIYRMFEHERPGYTPDTIRGLMHKHGCVLSSYRGYEYRIGDLLFKLHNVFHSPVLMALTFYPLYCLYLLDMHLKLGEPNGICFVLKKEQDRPR